MDTKIKDPYDEVDFMFNWDDWLVEGDSLDATEGACTIVIPDGLTLTKDIEVYSDRVVFWVSGGLEDTSYTVASRITTVQGRKAEKSGKIIVKQQ